MDYTTLTDGQKAGMLENHLNIIEQQAFQTELDKQRFAAAGLDTSELEERASALVLLRQQTQHDLNKVRQITIDNSVSASSTVDNAIKANIADAPEPVESTEPPPERISRPASNPQDLAAAVAKLHEAVEVAEDDDEAPADAQDVKK